MQFLQIAYHLSLNDICQIAAGPFGLSVGKSLLVEVCIENHQGTDDGAVGSGSGIGMKCHRHIHRDTHPFYVGRLGWAIGIPHQVIDKFTPAHVVILVIFLSAFTLGILGCISTTV